jgi:hypothetical protein
VTDADRFEGVFEDEDFEDEDSSLGVVDLEVL